MFIVMLTIICLACYDLRYLNFFITKTYFHKIGFSHIGFWQYLSVFYMRYSLPIIFYELSDLFEFFIEDPKELHEREF
jgi:hypothetical protein